MYTKEEKVEGKVIENKDLTEEELEVKRKFFAELLKEKNSRSRIIFSIHSGYALGGDIASIMDHRLNKRIREYSQSRKK